jgi:hypothetical protein
LFRKPLYITEVGCPSNVLTFRNLGVRIIIHPRFADVDARVCPGPQDCSLVCLTMKPAGVFSYSGFGRFIECKH